MLNNIHNTLITQKKFLKKKEINTIMEDIHKIFLKKKIHITNKNNNNKNFLKDRKEFDNSYYYIKKNTPYWPKIYDNLNKIPSYENIILKKISIFVKKKFKRRIKFITKKFRVIEKNDKRSYPIHQEYKGMKSKFFLIFWIAMHNINKSEGGLMIGNSKNNGPLSHKKNKMGYPVLLNQVKEKANSYEKKFSAGELLISGKYINHGTAKKIKGPPRWACLIRGQILKN